MGYGGELRANTAIKVKIGPVVAVANGYVPVTTLDLTTADEAELLKHDAAAVTDISAYTFAAIGSADGYYNLTIPTGGVDTEGLLTVLINDDSLCLPVRSDFMVLSEAAWDSKYIAKDDGFMDVNVKTVGRADTQETEATNLEAACAAYSATRGLSGTALPAAAADGVGGLPISDAGGLDLDTKLANTNEVTAARMGALTDWIDGGRLDLILDIIAADTTTDIPALIDALPTAAEIKTAIEAAGSHLALILADTGTDGVVLPQAQADKVWGTAARALTDKADFALSSASRDAIWDQASVLTLSFESLLTRAYQMINNKMNVTIATGVVALRNIGDTGTIATGSVTTDLTTDVRLELTWA